MGDQPQVDPLLHRDPRHIRGRRALLGLVLRRHPGVVAWLVLLFLTLGIGSVAYTSNRDREQEIEGLIEQGQMQQNILTRSDVEQRDINCRLLEEIDQRDIEDLALLRGAAREGTGNPATLNQLQTAERRAKRLQAPSYCDRPGIGLSEMRR